MNAQKMLHSSHRFIVDAIEALPEADWYLPGAAGEWSVKDVIAHLAAFEIVLNESLQALIAGSPAPSALRHAAEPQAYNDTEVARRKGRSARAVWGEYENQATNNLGLIGQIPYSSRQVPGLLAWFGDEHDLEDFIAYTIHGHKREHGAQIQVFKDRLSVARMVSLSSRETVAAGPGEFALTGEFDLNRVNPAMLSRLFHWMES